MDIEDYAKSRDLDELTAEMLRRQKRWDDQFLEDLVRRNEQRVRLFGSEFWQGIANTIFREPRFYLSRDNPEKALVIRERQAETEPSNISRLYKLAEQQLSMGRYTHAIATTATALRRMLKIKQSWEDTDRRYLPPAELKEVFKGKDTKELVVLLVHHVFNHRFKRASESCQAFCPEASLQLEIDVINRYLRETDETMSEDQAIFRDIILSRVINQDLPLQLHTENRNRVHQIRWKDFPEEIIYAKEYATEEAEKTEKANTLLFRRYLGSSIQRMVGINIIPNTIFLQAAGNQTLDEMITRGSGRDTFDAIKESARLLARIHALGTVTHMRGLPPDITLIDPKIKEVTKSDPAYFTHKLETTLFAMGRDSPQFAIAKSAKDYMREGHEAINFILTRADTDFYKDHNPRNIVMDEFGRAVAIDFESAKMLPCQLDLVSLLEFGREYLTEKQKRKAIETYIREKEMLMRQKIDRNSFMRTYQYARVHRHLEMIGYRTRDALSAKDAERRETELLMREYHIITAERALREITEAEPSPWKTTRFKALHEGLMQVSPGRNAHRN